MSEARKIILNLHEQEKSYSKIDEIQRNHFTIRIKYY